MGSCFRRGAETRGSGNAGPASLQKQGPSQPGDRPDLIEDELTFSIAPFAGVNQLAVGVLH